MSLRRALRRDPVTPEVRQAVLLRDGGCVAPLVDGRAGVCRNRWGDQVPRTERSALTLDHVKDELRMGKRAPSDPQHLVSLCWDHHLNGWATSHRMQLRMYLRSMYPLGADASR